MKRVALHKAPAALLAILFGIERETCFLDGGEISPDGAAVTAFLLGALSHSRAMFWGLNGPKMHHCLAS